MNIEASQYATKLSLKIIHDLIYGIAAPLVGIDVTAVKANDAEVPAVRYIEIIRVRRADNIDWWCNIYGQNRRIDTGKT